MLPTVYSGAVPRATGRSPWEAGHHVLVFSLKRKLLCLGSMILFQCQLS